MRYPTQQPVRTQSGFSEDLIDNLINVLKIVDGVDYTSYVLLHLSRPAICLKSDTGEQRTIAADNARTIVKEYSNGAAE